MDDEDVRIVIEEEEEIVFPPPKRRKNNEKSEKNLHLDEAAVIFYIFSSISKDIRLKSQIMIENNLETFLFGKMEELNKLENEFMVILEVCLHILQTGRQSVKQKSIPQSNKE
jgi:hypothetical protein